jgi:sigma-B regulation protein RsbU (phosphoserine phosphatase)
MGATRIPDRNQADKLFSVGTQNGSKFLRRILRPSTARRLGFWVLLGSACVLAASLGFVLKGARESVLARSSEAMATLTTAAANTLAARTSGVETSARVVSATIGHQLDNPAFIESLLQTIAAAHVEVAGLVAAFEPGAVPGQAAEYAPFYAHVGAELVHRDLAGDPGNYRDAEWYRRAVKCPSGCWGRPFHSHSRDQLLINFGVPIVDAGNRIAGVLNVDVPQQWLQDAVNEIDLGPASFGYLISEDGIFLASPNATSVATSIFDRARDSGTPELAGIAQRMMAGETGTQTYVSPTLHVRARTFFTRVPESHWSLALVVPENLFFRNAREVFLRSALIGLLGLTALGLFIWLATRRLLAPLGQLADKADHVARGELDFRLDAPRRMDEIGRLTQSFIGMRDELKQHIAELTEATAARERLQRELEIAQHIQESMLPSGHFLGPGAHPFELQAMLRPARIVGGDLYSYVSRGDRICFLVGDVSDKGFPAALFMARTITVANTRAATVEQPEELLRQLNVELCAGNEDCMFVTMLCGILDRTTGQLALASAGHDAPIRVGRHGAGAIAVETGPPLGLEVDAAYPRADTQLAADEALVLFTDGVTEARDPEGGMYGEERLLAALAREGDPEPAALIAAVIADVTTFMRDAPLADDLTVLALRCDGIAPAGQDMTIELGAQLPEVGVALDRIDAWLAGHGIGREPRDDVRVALEELMVNALSYGFPNGSEAARLRVALALDAAALRVEISDNGIAHDPFDRPPPDLDAAHDDRAPGGLGVFLVTQLAASYAYRRDADWNRIELRFVTRRASTAREDRT